MIKGLGGSCYKNNYEKVANELCKIDSMIMMIIKILLHGFGMFRKYYN